MPALLYSATIQDLISKLLVINPDKRLTVQDALRHQWFKTDGETLASQDLTASLTELKVFNARMKLKAAVKTVRTNFNRQMKLCSLNIVEKDFGELGYLGSLGGLLQIDAFQVWEMLPGRKGDLVVPSDTRFALFCIQSSQLRYIFGKVFSRDLSGTEYIVQVLVRNRRSIHFLSV